MLLLSSDAAAPPGGLTVAGLYRLLCDSNVSVLLMDVRSRDDFNASHVKTADCINIPADCLQPGSVLFCHHYRSGVIASIVERATSSSHSKTFSFGSSTDAPQTQTTTHKLVKCCLYVWVSVCYQGGSNHNCCTQRLVILHAQTH